MLITVTTTSQSLLEILTPEQIAQLKAARGGRSSFQIFIQNLGTDADVYAENMADEVTIAGGTYMAKAIGYLSVRIANLDDLKLIADGASAQNVRLIGS